MGMWQLYVVDFNKFIGRGGGIRTPDPLLPKQMRYQTALRPDDTLDCIANRFLGLWEQPFIGRLEGMWFGSPDLSDGRATPAATQSAQAGWRRWRPSQRRGRTEIPSRAKSDGAVRTD